MTETTTERPVWQLDCEVFALRDHESIQLLNAPPESGRRIAVMARSVELPPGPRSEVRTVDGEPVEMAAILAAEFNYSRQSWQWLQISAPSKEFIGDHMFTHEVDRDRWYYLDVQDLYVTGVRQDSEQPA